MKEEGFSSGDANSFRDCTGVCAWKLSEKSSPFFFSQPESEDIPFCPPIHFHSAHLSLSYTYAHLEESMLLLGKKPYKLNLKIVYFNKKYCIQHHPWNKFCLNVANLLWSASKILAYDFGSWFLNFKISKLRIYCNLPVITLIQMH